MKIALYYPWVHLKSGVERTILETVKRSRHDYTIFTNHYDEDNTFSDFKNLKVRELIKIPVRRNIFSTLISAIAIMFQKVDLSKFDALVIHSEGLGDLFLIRNSNLQTICFCHTPLRPVFDPEYKKRAMNKRNIWQKPIYKLFNSIFKQVDSILWKKYKYIFFNSKESINRAKKGNLLGINANHEILSPGVSWYKINPSWKYNKYFFVPGRIMWTKNIELAIDSYKLFCTKNNKNDFKLIIAGQVDEKSTLYFNKIREQNRENNSIIFITNPTDKKMRNLYKNCYATIVTSFNEDWGITPIEANAFGKPVIAVNRGGFKESQVDGITGFLVNPNKSSISNKMYLLAKNEKLTHKLGKKARNHSKIYDWGTFVEKFDQIFNKQPTETTFKK